MWGGDALGAAWLAATNAGKQAVAAAASGAEQAGAVASRAVADAATWAAKETESAASWVSNKGQQALELGKKSAQSAEKAIVATKQTFVSDVKIAAAQVECAAKKVTSKVAPYVRDYVEDQVLEKATSLLISPASFKVAANLIKAAGKNIKPLARQFSPELANAIGKATNKGTINAIGKALRALDKNPIVEHGVGPAASSVIIEFADRAMAGKPLFSNAALFHYGSDAVKGVLSAGLAFGTTALAGAIIGSAVPGPGTVVGFVVGLTIAVGASMVVDKATKSSEGALMKRWGIKDDE